MQDFTNNAASLLTAGISNVDTSIVLADASSFPTPAGGSYFYATLIGLNTNGQENAWEIVKCTAKVSNTLTVVRGQDGTVAASWGVNTRLELRMTAIFANAIDDHIDAKDASGGYPGLTLFKLNLRNAANTITSWFTNAATVARTWTMPDKDGTVAMTSDITGTNSGTNTGDNAANSSTHYIGTTAIALNRASAAQALTGITSIDGNAATVTNGVTTTTLNNGTLPASFNALVVNTSVAYTAAIRGNSTNASSGNGVSGTATTGDGVYGTSTSGNGGKGVSGSSNGIRGSSTSGYGVFASSATGAALHLDWVSSAPTTNVAAGNIYYNDTTSKFMGYNGTNWSPLNLLDTSGNLNTGSGTITTTGALSAGSFTLGAYLEQSYSAQIWRIGKNSDGGSTGNWILRDQSYGVNAINVTPATGAVTIPGQVNIGTYVINATKFQVDNTVSRLQIGYNGTGDNYLDGTSWNFRTYTGGGLLSIASTGAVTIPGTLALTGASSTLGYGTGAGADALVSRSTGGTNSHGCGTLTLASGAGSTTPTSVTITNTLVAATDVIVLSQKSGTDKYHLHCTAVGAGSWQLTFYTISGTTTEQPVFNFCLVKGVAA